MNYGKSIRLFLIEGIADGRWMCELSNWTGKAYKIPRNCVKESSDREELKNTGIYFLFGKSDETDTYRVYIGEAENIYERLLTHLKEKDFWHECVVFISKDNNLNKAHVKYLENRMYTIAKEAGRYQLENSNIPTQSSLSEADRAEMEEFINNAKLLLSAVGHKVLEATAIPSKTNNDPEIFVFEGKDYKATGTTTADGFVVFKNSILSKKANSSLTKSLLDKRNKLISENIIDSAFTFTKDYIFSSPSTAASIISGNSTNGKTAWRNSQGMTLKDYEN
ncbi:GIY-YIG nuclease family protein [Agathobacter rectalis]|jgi:hypothetical protein|uniref:GIY-YIG nuclease family protein n=1 Tax=Agathobacter rectalis TaxID=39491 RepID=A0A414ZKC5_9FIRM|nr:GIY-YIG nuclease family protein [Agathobacter rectalis]RHI20904.1 GIY-YIG nuclease family protein [Agathobacter rectalis]